jgi:hypothetical protein
MTGAALRAAPWLLSALIVAAPASAETVTLGFAPPLGRDLLYRIEQHRPVEGRDSLFASERRLRFEKAGDGYILRATLDAVDSDAPGAAGDAYRAGLSPLIGIEHRFRLDRTGRIVALDNIGDVWARAEAGLRKTMEAYPADSPRHRAAANVLTLFAALPPDGRLAMLAGELQPLFLFAGSVVMDGPGRALRSVAGSPLGKPVAVEGTVTLTGRRGDILAVAERLEGEGAKVAVDYQVAAASGLVTGQRRTLSMGARQLTETRSLTPAQN